MACSHIWADTLTLKNEEGSQFRIQINKLSPKDQIFARSQQRSTINPGTTTKSTVSPELEKLFGKSVINAKKKRISTKKLTGKKIGIYFSAHWCPPCRTFTPHLVQVYNELQEAEKPFEIVFVSSDRTEKDMMSYMKETKMPWLAVRHRSQQAESLAKRFNIRGIPSLIIVDEKGRLLSAHGRGDVSSGGASAFDKW